MAFKVNEILKEISVLCVVNVNWLATITPLTFHRNVKPGNLKTFMSIYMKIKYH